MQKTGLRLERNCVLRWLACWALAMLAAGVLLLPGNALAQKTEVAKPQQVTINTVDGVVLVAEYFESPKKSKETTPIIILHSSDGNRNEYLDMAKDLQKRGHSVLVPDLRGFGESLKSTTNVSLKPEAVSPVLVAAMVRFDMDAMKKFFMDKHNLGEVNINKLCLIGVEMGANVAASYAVLDWSWPVLATGKQGQDVKGLVLISPKWAFRSLKMSDLIAAPGAQSDIPVCVIVGGMDEKAAKECERIHKALERNHPGEKKELQYAPFRTKLQGAKLVNEPSLKEKVIAYVGQFVDEQVASQPIQWVSRDGPFK